MEGLNLKGSPQAIDSVDAVQIDSMVSSLRSLLDPLPNSFLPRPSSRQLQFSSKLISLVPIFHSIRQPSYKSIGTTRSLQLLPRLLFNLEISNRGATNFLFRNFSRNRRSSIEIFFKIFDRNFSSFADSTSKDRPIEKIPRERFQREDRDSNSHQRSRWWRHKLKTKQRPETH